MDALARVLATQMGASLGQPVVVENKPGASNLIGSAFVAKSPPDGYNILITGSGSHTILPVVMKLPYEQKDLVTIGKAADLPMLIAASPKLGVRTMADFVRLAKASAGGMNHASLGPASTTQMVAEQFRRDSGINMVNIPYKAGPPGLMAMLSGEVDFMVLAVSVALPSLQDRKLVPLAVTSSSRLKELPDVPTLAEVGYPGAAIDSSYGLYVNGGTPRNIIIRLNAAMQDALTKPEVQKAVVSIGLYPSPSSPETYAATLASLEKKLRPLAVELALKLD
jgi:tripartite-type tricarboxylate transporter receptor subunit TctC